MRRVRGLSGLFIFFIFFSVPSFANDILDYETDAKPFNYKGSFAFTINQRFFEDPRLSYVNGFSKWGAFSFDATAGLYEFSFGLEPILGFGFSKNSSNIPPSLDQFRYSIFTGSLGARYKPWGPEKFFLAPYVQALFDYRYVHVRKSTYNPDSQRLSTGGDLGMQIGAGVIWSFMYGSRRHDLNSTWDLKDFGILSSTRYIPAGFIRHGLGEIDSTGGWDFGAGIFLDW
jgi:hypothetical protein